MSQEILPEGVRVFRLDGGYSSRTLLVKGVQMLELPGNEPAYFDPLVGAYFTLLNSPRAGSAFGAADLKRFTVLTSTRPLSGEPSLLDPNYEYTLRKTHDGSAYYAKLGKRSFFKEKPWAPPEVRVLVFDMKSKGVKTYKKESDFKPGWRSKAIPLYGAKKGNWVALADLN